MVSSDWTEDQQDCGSNVPEKCLMCGWPIDAPNSCAGFMLMCSICRPEYRVGEFHHEYVERQANAFAKRLDALRESAQLTTLRS